MAPAIVASQAVMPHNPVMLVTRREAPILLFNIVYISVFASMAASGRNYEFLLYAGVVIVLAAWILYKQRTVRFHRTVLWGLSLWGFLHMAGGNVSAGPDVLYSVQLIPVVLRYDQFVHGFGFGVATLVCHHLLKPYLRAEGNRIRALAMLTVLMGVGIGAVNEIVEFIAVKTVPETHVGGYDNTLWDLIFNLIGAVLAVAWLVYRGELLSVGAAEDVGGEASSRTG